MNVHDNPFLAAALSYAERGWCVFPIQPGGKLPAIKGGRGLDDATRDPDQIREWWRRMPRANIGVATGAVSGFWCLDVDTAAHKAGADGSATLDALELEHGPLPATVRARTPTGGEHFLFRVGADEIRNSAGRIGPGLDTRGDGGYIVVAPSVRDEGAYEWRPGRAPDEIELAEAPRWLVDLYLASRKKPAPAAAPIEGTTRSLAEAESRYVEKALADELAALSRAAVGGRNDALNRAAFNLGQLVGAGYLSRGRVELLLRNTALGIGLEPREIEATLRSGLDDGIAKPRELPKLQERRRSSPASGARLPAHDPETGEIYDGAPPDGSDEDDRDNDPLPPEYSDVALAERFAAAYPDHARYVEVWGGWLVWDGRRHVASRTAKRSTIGRLLQTILRQAAEEVKGTPTLARTLCSTQKMLAVERAARELPRLRSVVDEWDADPLLLNTPGGVIDLETGRMHQAQPSSRFTRITAVAPRGECPTWLEFLEQITAGDAELQDYLQRLVGYCLTGFTREHAIFFLHGNGGNGKSVFLNTIAGMLDGYARTAPIETFMATHNERHPTDLASLFGARLVVSSEVDEGRRWAEAKLKLVTGGDRITARYMRQDPFEFTPRFKLVLAGNHRPGLRNVDEAIRRRLHLVPFTVTIPPERRDQQLAEKLRAEWPGILAWAVEGARHWLKLGLRPPHAVSGKTQEYLEEEDAIGNWIATCCTVGANAGPTTSEKLFASFRAWAERAGEPAGSVKRLSHALEARGFRKSRQGGTGKMQFEGIALRVQIGGGLGLADAA